MKREKAELSILYVDDEQILRKTLEILLKRRFSSVYTAENGKNGLGLFKLHRPDLVITDINMPVMGGIELTQEIRKLCLRTPIIVTSAYHYGDFVCSLKNNDWVTFLQKPFDMSILFQTIEDFCGINNSSAKIPGTCASRM